MDNNMQQPVNQKNTIALVGFILSFFTNLIALVLCIISLSKSKNYNGNGRKLAIAGIIIVVVKYILIFLLGIIFSLVIYPAIKSNITRSAYCSEATLCNCDDDDDLCTCYYFDDNGSMGEITCPKDNN